MERQKIVAQDAGQKELWIISIWWHHDTFRISEVPQTKRSLYLQTKFAALVSYGLTVELLKEVLPISQDLSATTIRQRVRQTAQRLEDGLGGEQDIFIGGGQRNWDQLPDPAAPLIVGIDEVMSMQKTNGREPKDGSR